MCSSPHRTAPRHTWTIGCECRERPQQSNHGLGGFSVRRPNRLSIVLHLTRHGIARPRSLPGPSKVIKEMIVGTFCTEYVLGKGQVPWISFNCAVSPPDHDPQWNYVCQIPGFAVQF